MRNYNWHIAIPAMGFLVAGIIQSALDNVNIGVPLLVVGSMIAYFLGRADVNWERKYGGSK